MIPENWRWVRLGDVYRINPKNSAGGNTLAAFVPMEKISPGMTSAFSFEVQPWDKAKKGHTQFADGDVAFAKISPCFENRKSFLARGLPNGIGGGTTELIVLRQPLVDPRYTFWLISDERFISGGLRTYSGTVGQQRISMDYVRNYEIPLPPFPEQQRIAARIESLFARLDEAADKLRAVVDGSELRRAAILHRAFTGELTAKWRDQQKGQVNAWSTRSFGEITENLDFKRVPLSRKQRENMNRKYDYYGASGVIDQVEDYLFDGRYLLIGEDGANLVTRSKSIAFIAEGQFWVNNHAHVLAAKDNVSLDFLCYYINFIDLIPYVTGSAQPKLTQSRMNTIPVPIPSIEEQERIVSGLEFLLTQETRACSYVQAIFSQIDLMKKSILARAFCGELGANDPAEECAAGW